jgi:hypothetical protein
MPILNWIPDPTPAAAERTSSLDQRVKKRWGDVCSPVAGAADVLWIFKPLSVGGSAAGWTLAGIPAKDRRTTATPGDRAGRTVF